MITHTIQTQYQCGIGTTSTTTKITGNGEANFEFSVSGGQTNIEFDCELDPTAIQGGLIEFVVPGDSAATCAVKVNSTGATPITLTANSGLIWLSNAAAMAVPPTGLGNTAITKFYITTPTAGGTVSLRTVLQAGPGQA